MLYPCGLVKSCHLVKSVSASLVTGRYFSHQTGLPRMPVPPLQQTCERYLSLLEPIVEVDELKRTKELVEEFQKAGGVGERLQRSLEMKARNIDNWLTKYGTELIYLTCRHPAAVYANTVCFFPQRDIQDKPGQIRVAAEMVAAVLEFKALIDNETLPVEHMRGMPLCMNLYSQALSACRIPGPEKDSVVFHGKSSDPPKHITVVHNCQFFVLEVYNRDGTPLTVDQLYVQLERICNSSPEANTEPVGILTTLDRDSWSKAYINLNKDKTNKESLSAIERSICTLCLDGPMPQASDEMYSITAGHQLLHGGGSQWNSANRWFDKSLQLIPGEDGTLGINTSHSICDGTICVVLSDYITAFMNRTKPEKMQSDMVPLPMPHKLHFNITPDIKADIEEAKQKMDMIVQDVDLGYLSFDHFGRNALKAHKMSTDAFIQVGIQLAYYRMYQRWCPQYESATQRMFRDGRVAVMTATSSASVALLRAFDDPKKQNTEKLDLLEKAMKVHRWNTDMACRGQTIYGHLMGLRMQVDDENISIPDLFTDPCFDKAFENTVCTSQVLSRMGTEGFLQLAEPTGYSILYSALNSQILFSTVSLKSCKENNGARLLQAFEDALLDMMALVEQTPRPN